MPNFAPVRLSRQPGLTRLGRGVRLKKPCDVCDIRPTHSRSFPRSPQTSTLDCPVGVKNAIARGVYPGGQKYVFAKNGFQGEKTTVPTSSVDPDL